MNRDELVVTLGVYPYWSTAVGGVAHVVHEGTRALAAGALGQVERRVEEGRRVRARHEGDVVVEARQLSDRRPGYNKRITIHQVLSLQIEGIHRDPFL